MLSLVIYVFLLYVTPFFFWQLQFAARCDAVVVLAGGRMAQQGTYEQLLSERDGEFAAMMRDYINEDQKSATDEAHVRMIKAPDAVAKEADATKSTTRYQLVKQEEMMIGSISRGVWRSWAAGLGPMMWIVLVLALCESSA